MTSLDSTLKTARVGQSRQSPICLYISDVLLYLTRFCTNTLPEPHTCQAASRCEWNLQETKHSLGCTR